MQAAISAQYTTLQRFGEDISSHPDGATAVSRTADGLVLVLSGSCVLREPALSAAAALWTAASLPAAAPAELAAAFVRGLTRDRLAGSTVQLAPAADGSRGRSFVQEHWTGEVRRPPPPLGRGIKHLPHPAA